MGVGVGEGEKKRRNFTAASGYVCAQCNLYKVMYNVFTEFNFFSVRWS